MAATVERVSGSSVRSGSALVHSSASLARAWPLQLKTRFDHACDFLNELDRLAPAFTVESYRLVQSPGFLMYARRNPASVHIQEKREQIFET
jgi:hypothetical protein